MEAGQRGSTPWPSRARTLVLGAMGLLAIPFIIHAVRFGVSGLTTDLTGETHLFARGQTLANLSIFAHMVLGAVITLLAPVQFITPLRNRFPKVHRVTGRVFVGAAALGAIGGLTYIVTRRTIGGPVMDYAFAVYGVCVLVSAIQTGRYARARNFDTHNEWALRLFVLAMGSWLYRVQYGLWTTLTGGLWMAPGFSGPFDLFQDFAFYVPYLIGVRCTSARSGRAARCCTRRLDRSQPSPLSSDSSLGRGC